MKALQQFIEAHAQRGTCRCGRCCDHQDQQPNGHTVDLVFFEVSATNDPDAEQLRELITESRQGSFGELNPFDGAEHSYIEVGAWVGDQGLALMLMGLGVLLNLWSVMTPKMLPGLEDKMVMELAERGMVAIMPPYATAKGDSP